MAAESTTTCACGCGTVVMVGSTPVGALTDRFIYDFDGELDYIELFVAGHDRLGLASTFRSRAGDPNGAGPLPWH